MILDRIDIAEIDGPVYIAPAGCVGFMAYHALKMHNIEVAGFCDNNTGLSGQSYDGISICAPGDAVLKNPDATFVIATVFFRKELSEQLRKSGARKILYAGQFMTREICTAALDKLDEEAARNLTLAEEPKAVAAKLSELFWLLEPRLDIDASKSLAFAPNSDDYLAELKQWIAYISEKYEAFANISITSSVIRQAPYIGSYLKEHMKKPIACIYTPIPFSDISAQIVRELCEKLDAEGLEARLIDSETEARGLSAEKFRIADIPVIINHEAAHSDAENKYNCVFVHIPKTAGTSMINMLGGVHTHHKYARHCRTFDAEKFDSYFKFAIVRNPWDRLVSLYFFLCDIYDSPSFPKSFKDYVLSPRSTNVELQADCICDDDGSIIIDYVGRFENLPESVRYIREKLGMDADYELPHVNASKHKHYTEYYDEETIEIVRTLFKRDIELFGYEFDKHPGSDIIINPREDFVPVNKR